MSSNILASDSGFVITDPDVELPVCAGDILICEWVDAETVPAVQRDRARASVDRASRELGTGHIDVRYFVHRGTLPANPHLTDVQVGFAEGDEEWDGWWGRALDADTIFVGVVPPEQTEVIGLHAGLRGEALELACRHEVRHVWQRLNEMPGDHEADAEKYARAA